ncbi:MAG: sugar isomerase domain-containing protein [Erysipelotrichia bacterium]|nr:sugar isomerase domain-containing protein [Erysipelotrichia bacterium]
MDFKFEYMNLVDQLLHKTAETNEKQIEILARKFADNISSDHIIHMFGTGHSHMVGIELFCRAGGLGNVNALLDPDVLTSNGARRSGALEKLTGLADIIFDQYRIEKGDIMIITSNSGRNAMPIEMAMRCKKEGIYCVALTNLKQSQAITSRHPSGKKLYECVDLVLDNCVADGDAMMQIGKVGTGPGSTISSVFLLDTIVTEAIKILNAEGKDIPVFQSQNVDGFDNDAVYEKYEDRIRTF